MRRRRALVLALALALALAAAGGVCYASWQSAEKLVHPPRELSNATPPMPFQEVEFEASDGVDLVGWFVPADHARGIVVFLHGYGDSKAQALPLLGFLHNASYDVFAYDARAHGASAGDVTTVGMDEVADVQGAIGMARLLDPPASEHLALLGWSMGAATALNAAPYAPEVDAVVADSGFATLTNIASNSITHFTDLPKYPFGPLAVTFAGWIVGHNVRENKPLEAVAKLDMPILVIQGLADDIAFPDSDGKAIAGAAPAGSDLWLVPDALHVQAHTVAPAEYEARVLAYLDARLS
ncbi:MAG TPA: alpha/beta fold hydrolase [Candidatus Thermoplasmatota archaeon]|nr:alpha/beta fold hydrolase [Candidatus Thermoplasmatota archaeon]